MDIQEELLARAKRHARLTGRSLQELVEDGLRQILPAAPDGGDIGYRLPDCSVGDVRGPDSTEQYSWQELRAMFYDEEARDWMP